MATLQGTIDCGLDCELSIPPFSQLLHRPNMPGMDEVIHKPSTIMFCPLWLVLPIQNDAKTLKNDQNPGKRVLS